MFTAKKQEIDLLISKFWEKGFIAIKRKYGTYIAEPPVIAGMEIDALGKDKSGFAYGICLSNKDLEDSTLCEKLMNLSKTKLYHAPHKLSIFIGLPRTSYIKFKEKLSNLFSGSDVNIYVFPLEQGIKIMSFSGFEADKQLNRLYALR